MNHRTLRKAADIGDTLHSVQPEQLSMAALLPQFSVPPVRVAATLNGTEKSDSTWLLQLACGTTLGKFQIQLLSRAFQATLSSYQYLPGR
ncbi:hypothetical protein CapIbe_002758 [Capra ibex]